MTTLIEEISGERNILIKMDLNNEKDQTLVSLLPNVEPTDLLDISEKIDDYIIPLETAAKLKGVSTNSIRKKINDGVIRYIEGVTLSSLLEYKVDSKKVNSGKISALKRIEKRLEEEKEAEVQSLEELKDLQKQQGNGGL